MPTRLRPACRRAAHTVALVCLAAGGLAAGPAVGQAAVKPKPQIAGLVDMGSQAPNRTGTPFGTVHVAEVGPVAAAFSGIVVNASWAQLEPTPGHFTFGVIQRSIRAVARYNARHRHHPLAIKLRVFGGFVAPAWAKAIGGDPITIPAKGQASGAGTVGRWWSLAYRAAWSKLQHRLAAKFDTEPLLRSVAVSSCSSLSAEPFIMPVGQAGLQPLVAAGFTSAAQETCLEGAFADYAGWKHTPIDYTFNPFPSLPPGSKFPKTDLSVTFAVMTTCADLRRKTGRSCVLDNHGLAADSATTSRGAPIYAEIDTLYDAHKGLPVNFQTLSPNTFGGCAAIQVAVQHHARAVELWPPAPGGAFKGYRAFSTPELISWAHAIRVRTGPSC